MLVSSLCLLPGDEDGCLQRLPQYHVPLPDVTMIILDANPLKLSSNKLFLLYVALLLMSLHSNRKSSNPGLLFLRAR